VVDAAGAALRWLGPLADSRDAPDGVAEAAPGAATGIHLSFLYRSVAKYWTAWVRNLWEKYLEIAKRFSVFPPQFCSRTWNYLRDASGGVAEAAPGMAWLQEWLGVAEAAPGMATRKCDSS
jgi:hypothetical protein